jgi:hypothetical protein
MSQPETFPYISLLAQVFSYSNRKLTHKTNIENWGCSIITADNEKNLWKSFMEGAEKSGKVREEIPEHREQSPMGDSGWSSEDQNGDRNVDSKGNVVLRRSKGSAENQEAILASGGTVHCSATLYTFCLSPETLWEAKLTGDRLVSKVEDISRQHSTQATT